MRERGASFKRVLNDAVRNGLVPTSTRQFIQKTYALGVNPHFRWDKALAISDAIEDAGILRKMSAGK